MSFLGLARKYRPSKFSELIGQELIAQTLKNSVIQNKVAQALLFSGGRGTGKTSCARIVAKALSCTNLQQGEPCGNCENCQEISKNHSIDTIEIDAASNRGIDNIRQLRDNLAYLPIKSKFKVYIIDEAHMLTTESFNALLKSLEEPPPHVKFILATTNPQKILQTIHSRCQRYDFHNITPNKITEHLKRVAVAEEVTINDSSLAKLAEHAQGAMRDALTHLDLAISFCGKQIKDEDLHRVLEQSNSSDLEELLNEIVTKKTEQALIIFRKVIETGTPLQILLNQLLNLVHKISIQKSCPQLASKQLPSKILLADISFSKLQQYFQILLEIEQQIKTSQFSFLCVEMGIIKLCSVDSLENIQNTFAYLEQQSILDRNQNESVNPPNFKAKDNATAGIILQEKATNFYNDVAKKVETDEPASNETEQNIPPEQNESQDNQKVETVAPASNETEQNIAPEQNNESQDNQKVETVEIASNETEQNIAPEQNNGSQDNQKVETVAPASNETEQNIPPEQNNGSQDNQKVETDEIASNETEQNISPEQNNEIRYISKDKELDSNLIAEIKEVFPDAKFNVV